MKGRLALLVSLVVALPFAMAMNNIAGADYRAPIEALGEKSEAHIDPHDELLAYWPWEPSTEVGVCLECEEL